jgi:hypothetical protein
MVLLVLSSPISITLSNVGVKAFKTSSVPTIPYYLLDPSQEKIVLRLCDFMKRTGECHVASDSTGGFTVKFPQPNTTIFVDKKEAMQCLSDAIDSTAGYGDADVKRKVFQIISQRIGALTVLPQARKV